MRPKAELFKMLVTENPTNEPAEILDHYFHYSAYQVGPENMVLFDDGSFALISGTSALHSVTRFLLSHLK